MKKYLIILTLFVTILLVSVVSIGWFTGDAIALENDAGYTIATTPLDDETATISVTNEGTGEVKFYRGYVGQVVYTDAGIVEVTGVSTGLFTINKNKVKAQFFPTEDAEGIELSPEDPIIVSGPKPKQPVTEHNHLVDYYLKEVQFGYEHTTAKQDIHIDILSEDSPQDPVSSSSATAYHSSSSGLRTIDVRASCGNGYVALGGGFSLVVNEAYLHTEKKYSIVENGVLKVDPRKYRLEIKEPLGEDQPISFDKGLVYAICAKIESFDHPITPQSQCTDSDGGLNYGVKGIVSDKNGNEYSDVCWMMDLTQNNPSQKIVVSSCLPSDPGCELLEMECITDYPGSELYGLKNNVAYKCPNGCSNGACNSPPTVTPPVL